MSGTGNFASVVSGSQPIDRDAKPTKSAFDTTAALAQESASNPGEARIMNKNAFVEKSAAEEAAERARSAGEKLTGKPEGDANAEAVKKSLMTTEIKFDQIHNDGTGVQHGAQSMAGKATNAAKDASNKATETAKGATEQASKTAQGVLGGVSSTASSAYNAAANTASQAVNSVTSTASSTANTASNKASETANSASQTASQAAHATSNKASETYNAASSTASSAANTASDKASQAANGTQEAGSCIFGTLSSTAGSVVNAATGTAGSVVNAATGTASSVLSAAQSFVGFGANSQEGADTGVPKASVDTGKEVPIKREGGDAHVVETAPSARQ